MRTSPTTTWTRSAPGRRSEFPSRNSLASTSDSTWSRPNSIVGAAPSLEVLRFERESGDRYITLLATGAWAKDSRNSRFLPTRGSLSRLSAEVAVPGSDLTYYKLFARHQRLFPLPDDFAFALEGELGYGDGYGGTGDLPLTENFFAGGLRSVRGFRANTLGPRDFPYNRPLGGNLKVVGSAELILPLPFTKDSNTFRGHHLPRRRKRVWSFGQERPRRFRL